MAVIQFDQTGERLYETGVDHVVLYPMDTQGDYPLGVAWNGVTQITDKPSGAEPTKLYADNINYLTLVSLEEMGATLEAYMYPDEFEQCDGSAEAAPGLSVGQQARTKVGLCWRTRIGNDILGDAYGYKIHLLYGSQATPSEKTAQTVNDSPEAATMSWEISTTPEVINSSFRPSAYLVVDSTKIVAGNQTGFDTLLEHLYGTEADDAYLPHIADVIALLTPA